jgi:hypothetical protein
VAKRGLFVIFATMLSAFAAASSAQQSDRAAQPLQLIDLTDEFTAIWERDRALPDSERVARFKAAFATILPGFYSHERYGTGNAARYDERLLRELNSFPERRAGIEAVSGRFAAMLTPARQSFEARFGPMTGYPPIYLVNSLGEFDGGTRQLPEGIRLLFGADVIHRLYQDRDVRPFFHHELFHLYHARRFSECQVIWCALWTEGLAVHVARELNPGASDEELLLTFPEPLPAAVERDRSHAVCAVVRRLDSTNPQDYSAMFSSGRLDDRLPPRFAYYVGSLAAAEIGRSRSLEELAALGREEVRPLLESTLRRLGNCTA